MADRPGSVALGTNVRAIRTSRGLTQTDLALKAGITKSYVCRIEKGNRPVKPELLERLADALDVEVTSLDEATVIQTRSTAWRITGEMVNIYGKWIPIETAEIGDPDDAKHALAHYRSIESRDVRAVRVETIETVEVW